MPLTEAEELELLELEEAEAKTTVTSSKSATTSKSVTPAQGPQSLFRTALSKVLESLPLGGPPILRALFRPKEALVFGKGLVSGATFGAVGSEPLAGSVMEPHPGARRAGEFLGGIIPILAAEVTGGTALTVGAAARGSSAFGQAVMRGAGTGMMFGGMKGAVTGRSPAEPINEAAKDGLIFSGFGAVGQALGYLRKVFGESVAEQLANGFINTEKKIAEKLFEQGKPSLGSQYLETELSGFKNRKEVYKAAGDELFQLENRIKARLEDHGLLVRTPSAPEVKGQKGTLLEYKPGTVQEIKPSGFSSDPTIKPPTTITETVPKRNIPFAGDDAVEIYEKDIFGVPVRKTVPKEKTPRLSPQTELGGFERTREVGSLEPTTEPVFGRSSLGQAVRSLWPQPSRGIFKSRREGTVDLVKVSESINPIKEGLDVGTEAVSVKKLENLQRGFLERNGEAIGLDGAMNLKRKLDDLVGSVYLKGADVKTALKSEAYENMANELRRQIYAIDPVLGELAAQESLMIRIRVGIVPKAAGRGHMVFPGFVSRIVNAIEGSPVSNLTAKTLKSVFGKPSKVIAPTTRVASEVFTVNRRGE